MQNVLLLKWLVPFFQGKWLIAFFKRHRTTVLASTKTKDTPRHCKSLPLHFESALVAVRKTCVCQSCWRKRKSLPSLSPPALALTSNVRPLLSSAIGLAHPSGLVDLVERRGVGPSRSECIHLCPATEPLFFLSNAHRGILCLRGGQAIKISDVIS